MTTAGRIGNVRCNTYRGVMCMVRLYETTMLQQLNEMLASMPAIAESKCSRTKSSSYSK